MPQRVWFSVISHGDYIVKHIFLTEKDKLDKSCCVNAFEKNTVGATICKNKSFHKINQLLPVKHQIPMRIQSFKAMLRAFFLISLQRGKAIFIRFSSSSIKSLVAVLNIRITLKSQRISSPLRN